MFEHFKLLLFIFFISSAITVPGQLLVAMNAEMISSLEKIFYFKTKGKTVYQSLSNDFLACETTLKHISLETPCADHLVNVDRSGWADSSISSVILESYRGKWSDQNLNDS